MTIQYLVAGTLAAMLVAYLALLWWLAVHRKRVRIAALKLALRQHEADPAWSRLHGSAAGAP